MRRKQIEHERAKSEMLKEVERIETAKKKVNAEKRMEAERAQYLMKQERNDHVAQELARKEQHMVDMKKYSEELVNQDTKITKKEASKKNYKTKIDF